MNDFKPLSVKPSAAVAMVLSAVMMFSPLMSAAGTAGVQKDETVYFQLNSKGEVQEATVVNAIMPVNGLVEDFGQYATVKNLSDAHVIHQEGDRIFAELPGDYSGLFYYEGQLGAAESPWAIDIGYRLDKKAIEPAALAGQKGHLTMTVTIAPNPEAPEAKVYTERLTVSLTAALKTSVATNVSAPGATVVTVGGDKQINMTVLPKQSKTFVIEADVADFEMASMTLNAVEASIGLDIDTTKATDGFDALADGAGQLVDGTVKLKKGSQDLANGGSELVSGFDQVLAGWKTLVAGITGFGKGLNQVATEGTQLSAAMTGLDQQLKAGQGQVSSPELKQLATQLAASPDPAVKQLAAASLGQMTLIDQTQQGIAQLNTGLSAYTGGVKKLDGEYGKLSQGLIAFGTGLGDLQKAVGTFVNGLKQLPGEVGKLVSGQKELHEGLVTAQTEMDALMADLPDLSNDKQAAMPSFVSQKNTPSSVQFLMRTPAIEIPEPAAAAVEEEAKLSFWERLMNLFGL